MSSVQFQPLTQSTLEAAAAPAVLDAPVGSSGQSSASPTSADAVAPTWYMRALPAPGCGSGNERGGAPGGGEGNERGGFFGVMDTLVDQLESMIGSLLGNGNTTTPVAGQPPAPAVREPLRFT